MASLFANSYPLLVPARACSISEWCAVNAGPDGSCVIPLEFVQEGELPPIELPDWEAREWARAILESPP